MKRQIATKSTQLAAVLALVTAFAGPAETCTRALYVGDDGLVITGRSMDWGEDMYSNLWVFPRGIVRDGAARPDSVKWTSKYGSLVISGYEAGTADGINEQGLVMNGLYLAESDYGKPDDRPAMSIMAYGQYVLDSFGNVAEAVRRNAQQLLPGRRAGPTACRVDESDWQLLVDRIYGKGSLARDAEPSS